MFRRKTAPIQNENGVSELFSMKLGSYDQWVLIRGENKKNPILLFLHGGPGTSNIGIAADTQKLLEKRFCVVNWDQLGSGLSFYRNIPGEDMTIARMIEYTHTLMKYLLKRFGQEKLYLAGHSWGSLLGIFTAQKYPGLIEKYIGVSQIADGEINEKYAYEYCYERAVKFHHKKAIRQLTQIGKPPYSDWMKGLQLRSTWSSRFGGTVFKGSLAGIYMSRMLKSNEYNLMDLYRFMSGFTLSLKNIWPEVMGIHLIEQISNLDVDAYFFLGKYDFQAPCKLAQEYISSLEANTKEIIWFENSAHMCPIEEQEEFQAEMIKLLDK